MARRAIENSDIFSKNKNIVCFTYEGSTGILNNELVRTIFEDFLDGDYKQIMKLNPCFLTDNIFGFSHGQNCQINNCDFGINIYKWLYEEIEKNVNNEKFLDIRPFHLLCNRQTILKHLIMFWKSHNILNDRFYKLYEIIEAQVECSFIIRNLVIKYNLLKKENIGKNILNRLSKIEDVERRFLNEILSTKEIWRNFAG